MNLRQLVDQRVRFIDEDGIEYEGYAMRYVSAKNNEPIKIEALIFDELVRLSDGHRYNFPIEFIRPDIKLIEPLKK